MVEKEEELVVTKIDVREHLRRKRESNRPEVRVNDKRIKQEKEKQEELERKERASSTIKNRIIMVGPDDSFIENSMRDFQPPNEKMPEAFDFSIDISNSMNRSVDPE